MIELQDLDGLAGLAALVNSLFLWPTVRALKRLEPRVDALERHIHRKTKRKATPRRKKAV